ncbi:MAG: hypothetical protein R2911_16705 [Caldilineaceae bacterium]
MKKIGDNIFRLLARDFYGSGDTQNIDAPNIDYAYFSNGDTEVTVVLRDADDALVWNSGAEQDFRLEGSSTIVANGGSVSGNRIISHLSQQRRQRQRSFLSGPHGSEPRRAGRPVADQR